jgi:2-dehydro-3-deoxyphosphogluconate aldolase/(4S)-4-hydroxy-2-oxoglutarate aldolase
MLAPLPQLEIVPVGGVDLENAAAYIGAGATAVGLGSSLVNERLLASGDLAEMTRRAAGLVDAIASQRDTVAGVS